MSDTKELEIVTTETNIVPLDETDVEWFSKQIREITNALYGDIPEHAIDIRPGRGGKEFKYISHGYVSDKLNQVFRLFWDWELQPIFSGQPYSIINYVNIEKGVPKEQREVAVFGKLTIRIYSPKGKLLETIHRTGEGGKVWENNTTFADAWQSASSDGLKRASFRLGTAFGLKLYYDDEERQEEYTKKLKLDVPDTIAKLMVAMNKEGISEQRFQEVTGYNIGDKDKNGNTLPIESDIPAVWEALKGQK